MQDLEFMHIYATATTPSLNTVTIDKYKDTWAAIVPLAQADLFAMHAILGVSALHSAHLRPSEAAKYTYLSRIYMGKALTLFQDVSNVTLENSNSILAFAFFLVIFSLGSPFTPDQVASGAVDPIESFVEVLRTLRGFWTLQPTISNFVGDSVVKEWLASNHSQSQPQPHGQTGSQDPNQPGLPFPRQSCWARHGCSKALHHLSALNDSCSSYGERERTIYRTGIEQLSGHLKGAMNAPDSPSALTWGSIMGWPLSMPPEFTQLIAEKKPMAMLLLAYWCVPLHHSRNHATWFLEGWAWNIVSEVQKQLSRDPYWSDAMQWPVERVTAGREDCYIVPAVDFNLTGTASAGVAGLDISAPSNTDRLTPSPTSFSTAYLRAQALKGKAPTSGFADMISPDTTNMPFWMEEVNNSVGLPLLLKNQNQNLELDKLRQEASASVATAAISRSMSSTPFGGLFNAQQQQQQRDRAGKEFSDNLAMPMPTSYPTNSPAMGMQAFVASETGGDDDDEQEIPIDPHLFG
jgi:hypothetical protein